MSEFHLLKMAQKHEVVIGRYQTVPRSFTSRTDAWARDAFGLRQPWTTISDDFYPDSDTRVPNASDTFYTGLKWEGCPGGYLCFELVSTGYGDVIVRHFWSYNKEEVENFAKKMNRPTSVIKCQLLSEDTGGHNKSFVKEKFKEFLEYIYFC